MSRTSLVLLSFIFSSLILHHLSTAFFFRLARTVSVPNVRLLSWLDGYDFGDDEVGDDRLIVLDTFDRVFRAERPRDRMLPVSESRGADVGPAVLDEDATELADVGFMLERRLLFSEESTELRPLMTGRDVVDAVVGDNNSGVDESVVLSPSSPGIAFVRGVESTEGLEVKDLAYATDG